MSSLLDLLQRIDLGWHRWCVYALWEGPDLVYVGYTKQFERRLGEHMNSQKGIGVLASFDFCTRVFVESKEEAVNLERATIAEFTPRYNAQVLYGKYIEPIEIEEQFDA